LGAYVGQFTGDYVFQVGVALVVLTGATAAWIMFRRRPYVKFAEFKRGIEDLRFEFRRSLNEARAATTRNATAAVSDKLLSVIEPIDASVTDLSARFGRLEERADAIEAFMAGRQTYASRENEQIAARLRKLEQKLNTLSDQFSSIEQTINEAGRQHEERHSSIDVRITGTEKQIGDLSPRLELGEKARADLGGLVSLFVKQLKRVNMTSAETAVRVAELETLRAKIAGLEERLSAPPDHDSLRPAENLITNDHATVGPASPSPGHDAGGLQTNNQSATTSAEEPSNQLTSDASTLSEISPAAGANGHAEGPAGFEQESGLH